MAKKGFGVVAAALTFGVVSLLRNKQNRQLIMSGFNKISSKMTTTLMQTNNQAHQPHSQFHHTLRDVAEAPAGTSTLTIDENAMVYEGGAQTAIFQYNEEQAKQSTKYH